MRKILVVTAILFASLVAHAGAAPFTPELEADYASALAWWGVASPPQCGSVTTEVIPADVGSPDGVEAMARGTQPRKGEWKVACKLMVFENYIMPGCFEEAAIRHEVGHMLGFGHSIDPTNVMYYQIQTAWCPTAESQPLVWHPVFHPPVHKRRARHH